MTITVNNSIAYPSDYGTLHNALGVVGKIENELQLVDIQIQIAKEKAEGYYLEWKGQKIDISPTGELSNWPIGFADQFEHAFVELLEVRGLAKDVRKPSIDWRHND